MPAASSSTTSSTSSSAAAPAAAKEDDKQAGIKSSFRVPPRYVIKDVLGQGAYGVVVSAMDLDRNKEIVAVKKIERVFDHPTFTKRTLREIRVLRLLKHENVISLQSIFATTTTTTMGTRFDDLYLVFDLMQTDLASIIKSPQPLSAQHVQFFLYQLLRGLKFLHSAGIIHRDIKPRNLLVNSNCDLKICDMGLARFDNSQLVPPGRPMQENGSVPEMTDYVATRWYRAPEIILQWAGYSKAIDMWAVGCILAELLARKPLFPGTDADHQITLICDVLGRPALDLLDKCQHEETKQFLLEIPVKAKRPLAVYPKTNDISAVDLLTRLLRFDPDKRLTVDKCLQHHYLSQLHCPSDEPESIPLDLARDFPFDAKDSSTAMLQEYVWKEIEIMGALYGDDTVSPSTSSSSVVIMPPPSPASKSAKFKKSSSLHQNSPLTSKRGPSIPTSQPSTTIPPPSSVVDAAATAATTTTATTTTTTTAASIRRTPKPPSTTAPPIGPRPVPKAFAHKPPANTRPSPQTAAAAAVAAVLCKREEGDQTDFSPRVVHTPIFEDDSMHTPKTTDPPAQQQQQQQQGGLDLRRGLTAPLGS